MTTAIKVHRIRLVPLGRHNVEVKPAKARKWAVELTFSTGTVERIGQPFTVKSAARAWLAEIVAGAKKTGMDARPKYRATVSRETSEAA